MIIETEVVMKLAGKMSLSTVEIFTIPRTDLVKYTHTERILGHILSLIQPHTTKC